MVWIASKRRLCVNAMHLPYQLRALSTGRRPNHRQDTSWHSPAGYCTT